MVYRSFVQRIVHICRILCYNSNSDALFVLLVISTIITFISLVIIMMFMIVIIAFMPSHIYLSAL